MKDNKDEVDPDSVAMREYAFPVLPVPAQGTIMLPAAQAAERQALETWRDQLLVRWTELEKGFQRRITTQREVIDNLDTARKRAQEERNAAERECARLRIEIARTKEYFHQRCETLTERAVRAEEAFRDKEMQYLAVTTGEASKPCVGERDD